MKIVITLFALTFMPLTGCFVTDLGEGAICAAFHSSNDCGFN